MSISYTRHNKGSEKYHEVKLWGEGARGAYLAHGLYYNDLFLTIRIYFRNVLFVARLIMQVLPAVE